MSVVDRGRVEMKNLVKNLFIVGLITGSFVFGLSTGVYKHFPFSLVYKIINGTPPSTPPWTGRNFHTGIYEEVDIKVTPQTGVYITYGQSNSSNSGVLENKIFFNTYMSLNQKTYKYKNPSLGGTGYGGSVWGYLGEKLVLKGYHDFVIFSNTGVGGKSIHSLNKGEFFEYFLKTYIDLLEKYGRVDGILFHQGESDNKPGIDETYTSGFREFLKNLDKNGIETPIYLSRVSYCPNKPSNKKIIEQQNFLITNYSNIFPGPNTDSLQGLYRIKNNCHFNLLGFEKFSDMWVESLIKNEK